MEKNWCDSCRKYTRPVKIFNWWLFFILLLLAFVGGIIYFIYYTVSRGDTCPICRQKKYLRYRKYSDTHLQPISKPLIPQTNIEPRTWLRFCPYCGTKLTPSKDYCDKCGIKI